MVSGVEAALMAVALIIGISLLFWLIERLKTWV